MFAIITGCDGVAWTGAEYDYPMAISEDCFETWEVIPPKEYIGDGKSGCEQRIPLKDITTIHPAIIQVVLNDGTLARVMYQYEVRDYTSYFHKAEHEITQVKPVNISNGSTDNKSCPLHIINMDSIHDIIHLCLMKPKLAEVVKKTLDNNPSYSTDVVSAIVQSEMNMLPGKVVIITDVKILR